MCIYSHSSISTLLSRKYDDYRLGVNKVNVNWPGSLMTLNRPEPVTGRVGEL